MAIQKKYRLTKKSEFGLVFANNKVTNTSFARIFRGKEKNSYNHPRFAIVVSKSVDKRAVYRNSIRRKIASIIQNKLLLGDFLPYDYIFIVKRYNSVDMSVVEKEINTIIQ